MLSVRIGLLGSMRMVHPKSGGARGQGGGGGGTVRFLGFLGLARFTSQCLGACLMKCWPSPMFDVEISRIKQVVDLDETLGLFKVRILLHYNAEYNP